MLCISYLLLENAVTHVFGVGLKRALGSQRSLQNEAILSLSKELPEGVMDTIFMCNLQTVIYTLGVFRIEILVQNWPLTLAEVIDDANLALEDDQIIFSSLARVVLDDRIALYFLLAGQCGVCANANTPCCTWINALGQVKRSMQKLMVYGICLAG